MKAEIPAELVSALVGQAIVLWQEAYATDPDLRDGLYTYEPYTLAETVFCMGYIAGNLNIQPGSGEVH